MKAEAYTKAIEPARAKARPEQAGAPADAPKVRTVTGHVRDPQGRPLAGVQLQASSPGGFRSKEFHVTDREGMFVFPRLPREPLTISLIRRGYRYQDESLPADRDGVEWTFGLIPDSEANDRPGPPQDEPIPPELRDRLIFVDLQPRGTDYLTDGPGEVGNDLNRLPRGVHRLGQTYFRIGEKMVHIQGRMRADLPQTVKGIEVRAKGRVLHFLHSTQGGLHAEETLIGAYIIHYADGSSEQVPLVYARDITNWWHRDPGRPLTRARPAWTGLNDAVERQTRPGLKIRLFDLTWTTPIRRRRSPRSTSSRPARNATRSSWR
jgi:hypothetical protein